MIIIKKIFRFSFRNIFKSSIFNFKKIIQNNEFHIVRNIFDELNSANFDYYTNDKHSLIYNFESKEVFIKQIISKILLRQPLVRLVFSKYNTNSLFFYPLPKEYQTVFATNKYNVSFFISSILWYLLVFLQLLKSIIFIIKFIFQNLISFFQINNKQNKTIYFVDLKLDNLPDKFSSNALDPFSYFVEMFPELQH